VNGAGVPAPQHSVDLSWNASQSSGVIGYNIYRGDTTGGPYSRINTPLEASTSYTDAVVSGGATYYYVITAVDDNSQESGYSSQVKAVIPTP
jgi:fibronectin type 3 domain-containing protein